MSKHGRPKKSARLKSSTSSSQAPPQSTGKKHANGQTPSLWEEAAKAFGPDFWKVNNSNPEKQFAVNVKVRLADIVEGSPDAIARVTGMDDFDRPVTEVPYGPSPLNILISQPMVASIQITSPKSPAKIGDLFYRIAVLIRDGLYGHPERFKEKPVMRFEELVTDRLVKTEDDPMWVLNFDTEEDT